MTDAQKVEEIKKITSRVYDNPFYKAEEELFWEINEIVWKEEK